MFGFLRPEGEIRPLPYAILAPALVLSQHLLVWVAFLAVGQRLVADEQFWILPLRSLPLAHAMPMWTAGLAFAFSLIVGWLLTVLSVRRATWSRTGYALAALAFIPGLQIVAVVLLTIVPRGPADAPSAEGGFKFIHTFQLLCVGAVFVAGLASSSIWPEISNLLVAIIVVSAVQLIAVLSDAIPPFEPPQPVRSASEKSYDLSHMVQGVFAGVTIIVGATFLSAVTLGAYGWGLFILTPFTVGMATGYLANRQTPLPEGKTTPLVLTAALLGSLALISFALEGMVCILMCAPVGAVMAWAGGHFGRAIARERHGGGTPAMSVALLPALFMLEASEPPKTPVVGLETIDIAASPAAVWQALTSGRDVAVRPGLIFRAGLAYPIRGRLLGEGVGARRIGTFSTGVAEERVTIWVPERQLAFAVLSQPPTMEEMSPYRKVHAPHVSGYFETKETRFTLKPLADGSTRLSVRAEHLLRIDPALYWKPIAQWAIHANMSRVLADIKAKAEAFTK